MGSLPAVPNNEDRRAAVLIAIDASKNLISIGVAFFAALSAFALNYRSTHTDFLTASPIILMGFAAVLTLSSIVAGLSAIGKAYRRGQRSEDAEGPSWSTRPISGLLGVQSMLGLAALLIFAVSIVFWEGQPQATTDTRIDRLETSIGELSKRMDQQEGALAAISANLANLPRMPLFDAIERRMDADSKLMNELQAQVKNLGERMPDGPRPSGR